MNLLTSLPTLQTPDSEMIVALSLDSLSGIWAQFGVARTQETLLREAAKYAVQKHSPKYGVNVPDLIETTLGALRAVQPNIYNTEMPQWLNSHARQARLRPLGRWETFISGMQSRKKRNELADIDPIQLDQISLSYEKAVTAPILALQESLRPVPERPLTDWDIALHSEHVICFFAQSRYDSVPLFLSLEIDLKLRLFAQWSRHFLEHSDPTFVSALHNAHAAQLHASFERRVNDVAENQFGHGPVDQSLSPPSLAEALTWP